jgi:hypothetical protein
MAGAGRRAESFVAFTPEDVAAFERLGGLTSWKTGVKWIIDEYAKKLQRHTISVGHWSTGS